MWVVAMAERGRIISGSSGSFLTPPGYPEQRFSVETDLRRKPENRGSMALSSAVECEWLDATTRAAAKAALDSWERPALDHPAVARWVNEVLSYFRASYLDPEVAEDKRRNVDSLIFDHDRDPMEHADEHAGVAFVRRYYPEFVPTEDDFAPGGYGQKAEAIWYAEIETLAALHDKIRNSDLVRMTDSDVTIHRITGTNLYRNAVATVRRGEIEKIAYGAEQAAGWARNPDEELAKGATRNWVTGQDYFNGEPRETRDGDTITYTAEVTA